MEAGREKYRLLLVDDEPLILRSVRAAIPWEELGIEVVAEARSGKQALEAVHQHEPHLILSDIRMPGMDGIALMQHVRSERPQTLFIIISGYGEFEYAREALRRGAFDYLLKPIDHDELLEMIRSAVQRLEQERRQQEETEILKHSLQTMSTLARERMFAERIEGTDQIVDQRMEWLEVCELQRPFFVCLVRLDRFERVQADWSSSDRRLWLFVIRNVLQELGERSGALAVFPFYNGEWVMLLPAANANEQRQLAEEIIAAIKRCTHLGASVGISLPARGMEQLSVSYHRAKQALYRQYLHGEGTISLEGEANVDSQPATDTYDPQPMERRMEEAAKALDESTFIRLWQEWGTQMEEGRCHKAVIERSAIELLIALHRHFEHWQPQVRFPLDALLEQVRLAGTLSELIDSICALLTPWIKALREPAARNDSRSLIDRVTQYIDNNYHKDLGIDEMAELVQLSVSHFCSLFKQETGCTFLEYLTKCRIEKACFMLRETDVKVYRVAPLVGYQDAKYFTQVFKRLLSMTPSEYRERAHS